MKTDVQVKLECLARAASLATAKMIEPNDVIPRAMEFFKWVNGPGGSALDTHDEPVDVEPLARRFAR